MGLRRRAAGRSILPRSICSRSHSSGFPGSGGPLEGSRDLPIQQEHDDLTSKGRLKVDPLIGQDGGGALAALGIV